MQVILYGNGAIREHSGSELSAAVVLGEGEDAAPYPVAELSRVPYARDARPALLLDGRPILTLDAIADEADVPRGPVDSVWVFERAADERGLYRVDVGGTTFWEMSTSDCLEED